MKIGKKEHTNKKHNLWDYVYFLCYLYLTDENDYNIMEYKIMSSISEYNLSWIPYYDKENEEKPNSNNFEQGGKTLLLI